MNKKVTLAMALGLLPVAAFAQGRDFGAFVERLLRVQSPVLYGFVGPLSESATDPNGDEPTRSAAQSAADQITLARGLKVRYLTRQAAQLTDMIAFWPDASQPSYLITCVEGGDTATTSDGRPAPSMQRIRLSDGSVETILRGMDRCDGIRTTAWGTILATEETSDGAAYEILDPLAITNSVVTDRGGPGEAATIVDSTGATETRIAKRTALPTMAWEGLAVLPSGVVIAGDELRPGSGTLDTDGGAIFKFVPANPATDSGSIASLAESPLAEGSVYAMQVSCVDDAQQYGQGCEIGNGAWVPVDAATARSSADAAGATGYYRPEDLHADPNFSDSENPEAVRFCWTNTGDADAQNYGEVVCGIDSAPLVADADQRTVAVNRFVEGDTELNQPDNFDFQPGTGVHYVIEDNPNGDIWACLPDGADRDIKSDGCVRVLSVVDQSAEPTGFIFTGDGRTAYVSIQHSNDDNAQDLNFDGYPTDDLLEITGFRPVRR